MNWYKIARQPGRRNKLENYAALLCRAIFPIIKNIKPGQEITLKDGRDYQFPQLYEIDVSTKTSTKTENPWTDVNAILEYYLDPFELKAFARSLYYYAKKTHKTFSAALEQYLSGLKKMLEDSDTPPARFPTIQALSTGYVEDGSAHILLIVNFPKGVDKIAPQEYSHFYGQLQDAMMHELTHTFDTSNEFFFKKRYDNVKKEDVVNMIREAITQKAKEMFPLVQQQNDLSESN